MDFFVVVFSRSDFTQILLDLQLPQLLDRVVSSELRTLLSVSSLYYAKVADKCKQRASFPVKSVM